MNVLKKTLLLTLILMMPSLAQAANYAVYKIENSKGFQYEVTSFSELNITKSENIAKAGRNNLSLEGAYKGKNVKIYVMDRTGAPIGGMQCKSKTGNNALSTLLHAKREEVIVNTQKGAYQACYSDDITYDELLALVNYGVGKGGFYQLYYVIRFDSDIDKKLSAEILQKLVDNTSIVGAGKFTSYKELIANQQKQDAADQAKPTLIPEYCKEQKLSVTLGDSERLALLKFNKNKADLTAEHKELLMQIASNPKYKKIAIVSFLPMGRDITSMRKIVEEKLDNAEKFLIKKFASGGRHLEVVNKGISGTYKKEELGGNIAIYDVDCDKDSELVKTAIAKKQKYNITKSKESKKGSAIIDLAKIRSKSEESPRYMQKDCRANKVYHSSSSETPNLIDENMILAIKYEDGVGSSTEEVKSKTASAVADFQNHETLGIVGYYVGSNRADNMNALMRVMDVRGAIKSSGIGSSQIIEETFHLSETQNQNLKDTVVLYKLDCKQ